MSGAPDDPMRAAARDILRELLPGLLEQAQGQGGADVPEASARARADNGHHNGSPPALEEVVPLVPPPPVAAVLRPSTWSGPHVPGEIIGAADVGARVESVGITGDDDLERFARALAARCEDPRERQAIRDGHVRFTLGGATATGATPAAGATAGATSGEVIRIEKGAVTERVVRDAKARGARLVLARGAVLTPLARDQARSLGVQIEREARC
jgi:hypothetical protein